MERKIILTIPNLITALRILAAPYFAYLLIQGQETLALIIFTIAVLTDGLDGYIARNYKQESSLGRKMDALADSILIITAFIMLYERGYITKIIAILLIIPRLITGLIFLIMKRKKFYTTKYAKLASLFVYTLIILLIIGIDKLITYLWFGVIYILSALHWIYVIKHEQK